MDGDPYGITTIGELQMVGTVAPRKKSRFGLSRRGKLSNLEHKEIEG